MPKRRDCFAASCTRNGMSAFYTQSDGPSDEFVLGNKAAFRSSPADVTRFDGAIVWDPSNNDVIGNIVYVRGENTLFPVPKSFYEYPFGLPPEEAKNLSNSQKTKRSTPIIYGHNVRLGVNSEGVVVWIQKDGNALNGEFKRFPGSYTLSAGIGHYELCVMNSERRLWVSNFGFVDTGDFNLDTLKVDRAYTCFMAFDSSQLLNLEEIATKHGTKGMVDAQRNKVFYHFDFKTILHVSEDPFAKFNAPWLQDKIPKLYWNEEYEAFARNVPPVSDEEGEGEPVAGAGGVDEGRRDDEAGPSTAKDHADAPEENYADLRQDLQKIAVKRDDDEDW